MAIVSGINGRKATTSILRFQCGETLTTFPTKESTTARPSAATERQRICVVYLSFGSRETAIVFEPESKIVCTPTHVWAR